MPKIPSTVIWQQAELLMQPALIRVIDNLRKQLEVSTWQGTYQDATDPYPGYQLCLRRNEAEVRVDLWGLCYQICFLDYHPDLDLDGSLAVQIDPILIDAEGEVDWHRLDSKADQLVAEVFANLPSLNG
ncbi:hypothetical protein DO97_13020 [Neosynechococcus sphagnicola sy1]|uniref:Uncharacterized protein n=1 Tax=Neosynechococcus sphagnicola sy1 TaxID=1497020 RepID=A0A098TPB1_9CYAN|nr:hypothetical protein [Neosynechococcus sphagnicola]KGF73727.1 hypothetical protein DO97_13020 [Neosynechococcus sphagnicola sy1]